MSFPTSLFDPPAECRPTERKVGPELEVALEKLVAHFNDLDFDLPTSEVNPTGPGAEAEKKPQKNGTANGTNGTTNGHCNGAHEKGRAPLSEREMMFLSRECFLRFLSATKGKADAAIERIERCIMWRRQARIDDVEALGKASEEEARMGKTINMGFAPNGSPIMYFFPHRNTLPVDQRKVVHALFMLERAMDLMTDGVTQVLVVFNFGGKRKGPPTSVSAARETLHILGEYYPELLGHAIIQEMPWMIRAFVTMMWPFVDPHTKSKINFYSGEEAVAAGEVDRDVLLKECGGALDLPYDYDTYWPALMETCLARRQEHLTRWRALGEPRVGREERLFKVSTPSTKVATNGTK